MEYSKESGNFLDKTEYSILLVLEGSQMNDVDDDDDDDEWQFTVCQCKRDISLQTVFEWNTKTL